MKLNLDIKHKKERPVKCSSISKSPQQRCSGQGFLQLLSLMAASAKILHQDAGAATQYLAA
jgi:hypothetical protein